MVDPEHLGLPIASWRNGQYEAIQSSIYSPHRFVAHCAPTGVGKSVMLVGEQRLTKRRTLILTSTKALMKQYADQFKALNPVVIKGKSDPQYICRATELGGEFYNHSPAKTVAEGPCQFGIECTLKQNGCTYYDLVRRACTAKLVISNYAAWISANMYTDGWGTFHTVMCDEAHDAEMWLAKMQAIELPHSYQGVVCREFPSYTTPMEWKAWARKWLPEVRHKLKDELEKNRNRRVAHQKATLIKVLQAAERILDRLRRISEDWLVVPREDHILFHPVWVERYAEPYLFHGAKKVVFASATMRPHTLHLLGAKKGQYDFFEYPSTFPVWRRPIYYYPVVKMHHGMAEEDNTLWVNVLDQFASRRMDRKGIIHTVSYARTKQLVESSLYGSVMVAPSSSSMNMASLQKFRMMTPPAILAGPSYQTGISLDYDQCRWAGIPKFPFGNINDPMIVARCAEDPEYSMYSAGQAFTQMAGRHVRSEDDWGEALVTDRAFEMFRSRFRSMIPGWIWAAVQKVDCLPEPLGY